MTVLDGRGAPVKSGDFVIWHDNSSSGRTGVYPVMDVKTRVKVGLWEGYGTWVNPRSVIVVESLPYVDGELNTPRTQNEKEKDDKPSNPTNPRAARKR